MIAKRIFIILLNAMINFSFISRCEFLSFVIISIIDTSFKFNIQISNIFNNFVASIRDKLNNISIKKLIKKSEIESFDTSIKQRTKKTVSISIR